MVVHAATDVARRRPRTADPASTAHLLRHALDVGTAPATGPDDVPADGATGDPVRSGA